MYRYNKEWSDVKELAQDESVPVVSIRYSDECKFIKISNQFVKLFKTLQTLKSSTTSEQSAKEMSIQSEP